MRNLIESYGAWGLISSALLLTGCALPTIHREDAPEKSQRDAETDTEALAEKTKASDAGELRDSGAAPDAPIDPASDPANRNEDRATFESLLPTKHNFAEWPMPDSSSGAAVKPIYGKTERLVIDKVTNLRWQRVLPEVFPTCKAQYPLHGLLQAEGTGCTWEEAREYCHRPEIAEELGPGEWRLPTKIELETLLDVTRIEAIDPVFETYPTDFFWTATPVLNPDGQKLAWAVDFSDGYPYTSGRYKGGRVRCVASADEADGSDPDHEFDAKVVHDNNTHLTWQRYSDSATRTWSEAQQYCEKLDLDGTGWRLPFFKELLTIVDPTRRRSPTYARSFPPTPNARFWTSSKFVGAEDTAYHLDAETGGALITSIRDQHFVRCVR